MVPMSSNLDFFNSSSEDLVSGINDTLVAVMNGSAFGRPTVGPAKPSDVLNSSVDSMSLYPRVNNSYFDSNNAIGVDSINSDLYSHGNGVHAKNK